MKYSQALVRSSLLAPVTAATTSRTATLDCKGADYASIVIHLGAEANTNNTNVLINLKEGDTTVVTNAATFNASYSITSDNTAAAVQVLNVDLKGRKRYLQLTLTPDTTTNGAIITSAVAELTVEKMGANSANADQVVVG